MKAGALLLSLVTGLLLVQPGFEYFNTRTANFSCMATEIESSCSQSSCDKQEEKQNEDEDDKDCGTDRCNPFMGCTNGNFYVHNYWTIAIAELTVLREKISVQNDNRISASVNECWHPPEII